MFPLTAVIGLLAGAGVVSGQRYKRVETINQANYMEEFQMRESKSDKQVAWNDTNFKDDNFGISFDGFRNLISKDPDQKSPALLEIESKKSFRRGLFMVTINHSYTQQCAVHQTVSIFNGNTRLHAPARGPKYSPHRLVSDLGTTTCTMIKTAGTPEPCKADGCISSNKTNEDKGPMVYTFLVDESGVRTWVWPKTEEPQNFDEGKVDINKFGPPTMEVLRKSNARNAECGAVAKLDNVRLSIGAYLCFMPPATECPHIKDAASCRKAIQIGSGSAYDILKGIKFNVDKIEIWKVDEKAKKCKPTDPTKIFNKNKNKSKKPACKPKGVRPNKSTGSGTNQTGGNTGNNGTDTNQTGGSTGGNGGNTQTGGNTGDNGVSIKNDPKRPECKPKVVRPNKGTGSETNQTGGNTGNNGTDTNQTGGNTGNNGTDTNQTGGNTGINLTGGNLPGNNQTGVIEGDKKNNSTGTYVTRVITRIQTSKCPAPTPTNCTDKVVTVVETEIAPVITPQITTFFKTITAPCQNTTICTMGQNTTLVEKWFSSVEGVPAVPAVATSTLINYVCVCPPEDPNCPNKDKVVPTTLPVISKATGQEGAYQITKTLCVTKTYTVTCKYGVAGCTDGAIASTTIPTAIEVSPVTKPTTVTTTVTCTQKPACTDVVKVICLACVGGTLPPAQDKTGISGSQLPALDKKPLGPVGDMNMMDGGVEGGAVGGDDKMFKPQGGAMGGDKMFKPQGGAMGGDDNTKSMVPMPSEGKGTMGTDSSVEDKPVTSPQDKSDQGVMGSSSDMDETPATMNAQMGDLPEQDSASNEMPVDEMPAKLAPPAPAGDAGMADQAGAVDSADSSVPVVDVSSAAKPVLSLVAVFAAMLLW